METELERLGSFELCRLNLPLNIFQLARSGLYFDRHNNVVCCIYCSHRFNGSNTLCSHVQIYANDSLPPSEILQSEAFMYLQNVASSSKDISPQIKNIIDSMSRRLSGSESIHSGVSDRQCRIQSTPVRIDSEPHSTQEIRHSTVSETYLNATSSVAASVEVAKNFLLPTTQAMAEEQYLIRLNTFLHSPVRTKGPSKESLAWYGWYYIGPIDKVRCSYCHNNLHSWEDEDHPLTEHKRWFESCSFLKIVDSFKMPSEIQHSIRLPVQSSVFTVEKTNSNSVSYRVEPREVKARLDTYAAKAVMEMGYSKEVLRNVIENRLRTVGDDFPSVLELMEAVMTYTEEVRSPGPLGASNWTPTVSLPNESNISEDVHLSYHFPTVEDNERQSNIVTNTGQEDSDSQLFSVQNKKKKKKAKNKKKNNTNNVTSTEVKSSAATVLQSNTLSKVNTVTAGISTVVPNVSVHSIDNRTEDTQDPELDLLLEENAKLKNDRICKVCMEKEINTVFLPCGHLVCCEMCTPMIRECCICRVFIRGTVKTYLS